MEKLEIKKKKNKKPKPKPNRKTHKERPWDGSKRRPDLQDQPLKAGPFQYGLKTGLKPPICISNSNLKSTTALINGVKQIGAYGVQ